MPNAAADSWGILLNRSALNRGIARSGAHNERASWTRSRRPRGSGARRWGSTYAGALLPAEAHKLMQARRQAGRRADQARAALRRQDPGQPRHRVADLPRQPREPGIPGRARGRGAEGPAGHVHLPLRRALARAPPTPPRAPAGARPTTCSRASRATRTPSSTATPSAAGARPAYPGFKAEKFGVRALFPQATRPWK